jgi:Glycosyl hydrolase family 57
LWEYEDLGHVHLSLSGTVLEMLPDPRFQARVYGIVDCGSLLWHLQNTRTIEVLGTAHYHAVLPLIPRDRDAQLARWLGLGCHLFWPDRLRCSWPPELGFSMDLVPAVARQGYDWADRRQRARETTYPDTGFVQWTGSSAQRDALARVAQLRKACMPLDTRSGTTIGRPGVIEEARWQLLRAETSCNVYFGDAWVQRCQNELDEPAARLDHALQASVVVCVRPAAQPCATTGSSS